MNIYLFYTCNLASIAYSTYICVGGKSYSKVNWEIHESDHYFISNYYSSLTWSDVHPCLDTIFRQLSMLMFGIIKPH